MTEMNVPSTPNRFWRALLRVLLVIAIGGMIGVLIFIGLMYAARQVIIPIRTSADRLMVVETSQSDVHAQWAGQAAQENERLAQLENQRSIQETELANLQENYAALDQAIQAQATSLSQIEGLKIGLDSVSLHASYISTQVGGMILTQTAEYSPVRSMSRDLAVLRAMELLSRSRLFMLQANYGIAAQDATAARDVLVGLRDQVPDYQRATVNQWINRIDLGLSSLPNSPVIAADDLEIAWRLMANGLPGAETSTPTPWATPTQVETSSPTPWISPTPIAISPTPVTQTTDARPSKTPTAVPTLTPSPTAIAPIPEPTKIP